jgi:hypothetical protein
VSSDAARAHPFGDRGDDLPPRTAGRLADRGPVRAFCCAGAATAPSATSTAPTTAAPTSTAPSATAAAASAAAATAAATTSAAAATAIATTASAPAAAHASAASAGAATATTASVATAARANGHRDSAGARRHDRQRVDVANGRLELVNARRRQSAGRRIAERLFRDELGRLRSAGVRLERRSRDSRAIRGCLRLPTGAQAL